MRHFLALSLATTLLSGCSCKGAPTPPASTPTAAQAPRPPPPPQAAPTPPPKEPTAFEKAMQLHAQGRRSGEAGNFQEALKLFGQARELAPEWPLPLYDTAFTWLLMGEPAKALSLYEEVDRLAPQGFSDTKKVVECLRREKAGRVPKGSFRKYVDLMRLRDAEALHRGLEELARAAPNFYPAAFELVALGKDNEERERRLEKTLALQPDVRTRGELLVYKAQLLRERGRLEESRKLLQSLVDDPKELPSTVAEAREALSSKVASWPMAAPVP